MRMRWCSLTASLLVSARLVKLPLVSFIFSPDSVSEVLTPRRTVLKIEEYLPETWRPQFHLYKNQLVDILARTGIIYPTSSRESGDPDRPGTPSLPHISTHLLANADHLLDSAELAQARTAHNGVSNDLDAERKKLEELKESLAKDWGVDWEWKKLENVCVEKDLGESVFPPWLCGGNVLMDVCV